MITTNILENYFPYCTQQGADSSMINRKRINQLILQNPILNSSTITNIIQQHLLFLQNGGAGGQWKTIHIKGIVIALYFGDEIKIGKQANFELKQIPKTIDLQNVILSFSNFCSSLINGVNFKNADLSYSVLTDVEGKKVNFSGTQLAYTDFTRANLEGANFKNANLIGADFENCNLTGANFKGANLRQARFPGAVLKDIQI